MTLWFWPFLGHGGPMFFADGLGLAETFARYWRFYSFTSLPWDTGRALLANVPLVLILARPVGNLLERVRERFHAVVVMPADQRFSEALQAGRAGAEAPSSEPAS